jgi:glucans biosynthesis protein
MTHDPMRQADIERRLANMAKAPRCGAKTRAGAPCGQAAVKGRTRCRMHGGAKGSGGPRGDRNGNFKYGLWTRESIEMRKATRAKVREIRAFLRTGNQGGGSR